MPGAIMVLFVFVVMLLNLGEQAARAERALANAAMWTGPLILAAILMAEFVYLLAAELRRSSGAAVIGTTRSGSRRCSGRT